MASESGTPPSERICYEKIRTLSAKNFIEVIGSEWSGTRIRPRLPEEIPGLIPLEPAPEVTALEDIDFFSEPRARQAILARDGFQCFYCRAALNDRNAVIEHVVSRPEGDNSFRNLVASCRTCNNRKGKASAEDLMRTLYREGFLAAAEFEAGLSRLENLKAGKLKPERPELGD